MVLPETLLSKEFFINPYFRDIQDETGVETTVKAYFEGVDPQDKWYAGDIFLFGNTTAFEDFRKLHLAVCTGTTSASGEPLFLHASHAAGGVGVWELSRFFALEREYLGEKVPLYRWLFGIRRLSDPALHQQLLERLPSEPVQWRLPEEALFSYGAYQVESRLMAAKLGISYEEFLARKQQQWEELLSRGLNSL